MELGRIEWQSGGWLTVWVQNLTPEADPGNTIVYLDDVPHWAEAVHPTDGQINVRLRPMICEGDHRIEVSHRGKLSAPQIITVAGKPPAIRGLEAL